MLRIADGPTCSLFCFPHECAFLHDPKASRQYVVIYIIILLPSKLFSNTANAHRLFVIKDASMKLSPTATSSSPGNLSGIVSIVDSTWILLMQTDSPYLNMGTVLSLFARIAQIRGVDPTRNQRHRRASSASSQSSRSDRDLAGSRSSSRTSLRPSSMSGNSPPGQSTENSRTSMSGLDPSSYQWAERVPK